MVQTTLVQELNRLAGTSGLTEVQAANAWAGTTGLELVQAVNVAAGTSGLIELVQALNAIAGTTGLTDVLAASLCSALPVSGAVAWWDSRVASSVSVSSGAVTQMNDLSGNGLHLTQGTAASQPKFLRYSGEKYVWLPGVASNYLSAPDAAAYTGSGTMRIMLRVRLDDWTPSTTMNLLSHWHVTGNQRGWYFFVQSSGALRFQVSADGSAASSADQTSSAPSLTNNTTYWVGVEYNTATGALTFYKADDGFTPGDDFTGWTQISTHAAAAATPFNSTAALEIGTHSAGSINPLAGRVYEARLYSGGSKVAHFKASDWTNADSTTCVSSATGETWTANRNSAGNVYKTAIVDRNLLVFDGSDDFLSAADNDLLDFALSDSFTVVTAVRQHATITGQDGLISKKSTATGIDAGWAIRTDIGTPAQALLALGDGTNTVSAGSGSRTNSKLEIVAAKRDVVADGLYSTIATTFGGATTDTTTASLANALTLRVAAFDGGSAYTGMEWVATAIFRRALTDAELSRLNSYFTRATI